jgi:hypothetical protein
VPEPLPEFGLFNLIGDSSSSADQRLAHQKR